MNDNVKKIGLGVLVVAVLGVVVFEGVSFFSGTQMNVIKGPAQGTPGHGMGAMMKQLGAKQGAKAQQNLGDLTPTTTTTQ